MSDEKPGNLGGGGPFEVPAEASASAEPGKSAFYDPALGQKLEAFDPGRSLDDLDRPRPTMGECIHELLASINPIGKDMPQPRKAIS